jgi:Arc/MetJ family transcription regulator
MPPRFVVAKVVGQIAGIVDRHGEIPLTPESRVA